MKYKKHLSWISIKQHGNQKTNEEFNLRVGFDDTFETENYILSIVLRANWMISLIVRKLISKESNVFKKNIYKTLERPQIKYWTFSMAPVSRLGNWSLILK